MFNIYFDYMTNYIGKIFIDKRKKTLKIKSYIIILYYNTIEKIRNEGFVHGKKE